VYKTLTERNENTAKQELRQGDKKYKSYKSPVCVFVQYSNEK